MAFFRDQPNDNSNNNNIPSSFPAVPSSLSANDHGMRDYYTTQDQATATRNNVHSLEDLTPYLGLRARLSQVWLNKWTILILLVLARVLIAIGSLHDDIDAAEAKALSACTSVEAMGSTMASMPHYLAEGTNDIAAKGITSAVNGLQSVLFMALTAVEQIFLFVINMMYGTYECLITFAVTGTAHAAIALIGEATTALNKTIGELTSGIQTEANNFENGLNQFIAGLSSVASLLGGNAKPPTLNFGDKLTQLNQLRLPGSINDELSKVNNSIPTFEQVHNFTNTVLSLPFEEVRKLLNQTLGTYTFDQSIFQVPAKKSLQLCNADTNSGITVFFDSLYTVADTARKVFIVVLLLAAIGACIPIAWMEIRRWRRMNERAQLIKTGNHEPLDVIYIVSRPVTAGVGLKAAHRFGSAKRQTLTRWFIAYITSTPALVVLAIALAGLFSCLCQFILLKSLEKEVPALATQVGQFADKVVLALDDASSTWANTTNTAIIAENTRINNNVFGWVNTTTTALNSTLDTFINTTTDAINKAFGGTLLEDPVKEVFKCLIGLKVAAVQKGLTWAQEHAHVDFPLFPNDTFSAGASKAIAADNSNTGTNANGDSFLASPGSEATDAITGAVVSLINKLYSGIRTEALIAVGVLLCYIAVVLIGASWTMYQCCTTRNKLRGNGGASYAGDLDAIPNGAPLAPVYTEKPPTVASVQPTVVNTASGPVYDWSQKSTGPTLEAFRHDNTQQQQNQQSHGVIVGSYEDDHHDDVDGGFNEKKHYPAF